MSSDLDNEWLCPFCASLTGLEDKECPACQHSLYVFPRVEKKRSVILWRGIFFQYLVAIYAIFAGAGVWTLVAKDNGISNPLPFWPLYFGLPADQPPQLSETLLAVFPRWIFWAFILSALYSVYLMIILYGRVQHGNLFYMINAGITISVGLAGLALFQESFSALLVSLTGTIIGIIQLYIAINLWRDFDRRTIRLKLIPDSDVRDDVTFFQRGRDYGQKGMWGMAVIHLRRAVVRRPNNLAYQLALTVAYINIKRYDLALESYKVAKRLGPQAPQVRELGQQLAGRLKIKPLSKQK